VIAIGAVAFVVVVFDAHIVAMLVLVVVVAAVIVAAIRSIVVAVVVVDLKSSSPSQKTRPTSVVPHPQLVPFLHILPPKSSPSVDCNVVVVAAVVVDAIRSIVSIVVVNIVLITLAKKLHPPPSFHTPDSSFSLASSPQILTSS
jgi:hypothetical protein